LAFAFSKLLASSLVYTAEASALESYFLAASAAALIASCLAVLIAVYTPDSFTPLASTLRKDSFPSANFTEKLPSVDKLKPFPAV
jgi:hypothetical protein